MRSGLVLINQRIFAITLLGFSSGLPLALTSSTLQAWFTQAGVGIIAIGFLSLLGLPYVWKFLWAPLVDKIIPPFLGRRRGWIALMQLLLCFFLIILAQLQPGQQPFIIGLVALCIAFLSATQDIAVDAYRTDILLPKERGVASACYIASYRVGMLISGGLALLFADHLGWRITYEIMALLLAGMVLVTYASPATSHAMHPPQNFFVAFTEPFRDLYRRDSIITILLFILCYKMGDALALSLMSSFLLRELGFSLTEVGLAYKVIGLFATIAGAFVGGVLLQRLTLYMALLYFGLAQAFSNLMFMMLAVIGKHYVFMTSAIFVEHFCSGMSTAAFLAFLMSLCHQQYSATQFACLSALASVGRVVAGPVAGIMVACLGWPQFFGWTVIIALAGIGLLLLIKNKVVFHGEPALQL